MTQPVTPTTAAPNTNTVAANGAPPQIAPETPGPDHAARAAAALSRAREDSARKQREIGYQKQIADLEIDAKELRELRKLAEADDLIPFLDALGAKLKVTPQKVVSALKKLQTGDYASEREKQALLKQVQEATAVAEATKKELESRDERARQTQIEAEARRHFEANAKHAIDVAADAEKYPHLARFVALDPDLYIEKLDALVRQAQTRAKEEYGVTNLQIDLNEAIGWLEKHYADASKSRGTSAQTQQSEQDAAPGGKQTPASPRAKTITSDMKQSSVSAPPKMLPKGKARLDHLTAIFDAARRK